MYIRNPVRKIGDQTEQKHARNVKEETFSLCLEGWQVQRPGFVAKEEAAWVKRNCSSARLLVFTEESGHWIGEGKT